MEQSFEINFRDGNFLSKDSFSVWNKMWEPDGTTHEWCSDSHSPDGTGCLRIIHPPEAKVSASHITQVITLVKDAKYKFSGYIKHVNVVSQTANGNGGAYCTLGDKYIGVYSHQDVPFNSDWTYYESFYTATYTGNYDLSCRIWGAYGVAYFDDLSVELVEKLDPEVTKHWAPEGAVSVPTEGFSLFTIGDPQIVVAEDIQKGNSKFTDSMHELVSLCKDWNTKYIIDMGDVTDVSSDPRQWVLSVQGHDILQQAGIPYAVDIGNHDYNGLIGLRSGVYVERNTSFFREAYPFSKYVKWLGTENFGSFDGTMLNTFHKFTADGRKYIILAIEYSPQKETLDKVADFCRENSDSLIIFSTHCLFQPRGDIHFRNEQPDHLTDGMSSEYMWDNIISVFPNIFLTLCGHCDCHGTSSYITFGKSGNLITNVITNPQGTLGGVEMMSALINIKNGTEVTLYAYSPTVKKFYCGSNYKIDFTLPENSLHGDTVTLPAGFSGKIFSRTILDGALLKHDFSSTDPSVATLDSDGTIHAVAPGSCQLHFFSNTAQSLYAQNGPGARMRIMVKVEVK